MKFSKLVLSGFIAALLIAPAQNIFAADAAPAAKLAEKAPATATVAEQGPAWAIRCNKDDKAKETDPKRGRCEAYQSLIVKESKQRFVEIAVGFPKEKSNARGIVIVPLGILLQPGVQLKVDDGKPFVFQIRYCDPSGCYGYIDLNEQLLATLRNGTKLTLTFKAINQKAISVEVGLKGFADVIKQVS